MKCLTMLVAFSIGVSACATRPAISAAEHDYEIVDFEASTISDDIFLLDATCIPEWGGIVDEWRENGGGLKGSILATRRQIEADKKSRFAAFVRATWSSQNIRSARPKDELGLWPVSDAETIRLVEKTRYPSSLNLKEECKTTVWLQGYLMRELVVPSNTVLTLRTLDETPNNILWTSPFAQQWVEYWLLVRIK